MTEHHTDIDRIVAAINDLASAVRAQTDQAATDAAANRDLTRSRLDQVSAQAKASQDDLVEQMKAATQLVGSAMEDDLGRYQQGGYAAGRGWS